MIKLVILCVSLSSADILHPDGEISEEEARLLKLDGHTQADTIAPDCSAPDSPCVGKGPKRVCGGITDLDSNWQLFDEHGTHALMLSVDTSECSYLNTPIYLPSLVAAQPYGGVVSVSMSLYAMSPVAFTVMLSLLGSGDLDQTGQQIQTINMNHAFKHSSLYLS